MPLINFTTNLTSLKYGQPNTGDRPGGGYSGQPYIQFPIEGPDTPDEFENYYQSNRNGLDFPIRGGAITQLVNGSNTTVSAAIDRKRIEKFFKDAPRGTAFIQKQVGLQLSNPRTQVPQSLEFVGFNIGNAILPVTQTYDPINTLAQVAVQGTGLHFNRHGISPTIYETPQRTYQYFAGAPQNNTDVTNRLAILRALKLIGSTEFTIDPSTGLGIDPGIVDRLGISTIKNQILNYSGGPGSVYGIGFTRVFRATDTQPVTAPVTQVAYSSMAFTYKQLAEQERQRGYDNAYPNPQDYRQQVNSNVGVTGVKQPTFDYKAQSLEYRLNTGNPGARLTNTDYRVEKLSGQDLVNMKSPFYYDGKGGVSDPWSTETTDIIKFAFECMSNDTPGGTVALLFRAFLEGQIADNNSAEYNSFKYLGRGETFRTYQGFSRSISFTFKIAAQSRQEMKPLYTKLNHLISQVYPDYSPGTNIMRGNVVKLTIGDYIYRMPGFLENVNVAIDNANTPWEIVLGGASEEMAQLPHFVTVSCTFYPIMDILPRREKYTALSEVGSTNNSYVPLIVNTEQQFLNSTIRTVSEAEPIPPPPRPPFNPTVTPAPNVNLTIPSIQDIQAKIKAGGTQ